VPGGPDVGEIVGVEERFEGISGRYGNRAVGDQTGEEALAEVLGEPRGPHHGPLQTGLLHGPFGGSVAVLTTSGQQHQAAYAGAPRELREPADPLRRGMPRSGA
jgi:hypothetical protein